MFVKLSMGWNRGHDPASSDVIIMGRLLFHPVFVLSPRNGRLVIEILVAAIFVFGNGLFPLDHLCSVVEIDLWVVSPVVLQHAINYTQDLVHTKAEGSHFFHALFGVLFINATDVGGGEHYGK